MEFWQELIKLFGGAIILIAAVAWLFKSLITALLSKDIETFKNQLRFYSESSLDHLSRKRDVYVRLINSMRALLEDSEGNDQNEFLKAYNEVCLWAPPQVAKSISHLLALAKEGGATQAALVGRYTACLIEMRKDCGFNDEKFEYHIIKFKDKKP